MMGEPMMMGSPRIAPADTAAVDTATVEDCESKESLQLDEELATQKTMGRVKMPERRLPIAGEER
tara:strand:- start:505 stop:699 length:195 start_codon:yes stop_codon:yes gene_type:complete